MVLAELRFSEDELAQLHLLVQKNLEASRVELNHTASLSNREYVKRRLDREQDLLKKLEAAMPALRDHHAR